MNGLCIKPICKSRLSIPLFCLVLVPWVWPILEIDMQILKNKYVNRYHEGNRMLYVFVYNGKGNMDGVIDVFIDTWNDHQRSSMHNLNRCS